MCNVMDKRDETQLKRIESKLDDMNDHMASMDIKLGQQHISLKEHMRRTALLEDDMKPIRKKMAMFEGALQLIGVMAAIAALVEFSRWAMK